MKHFNYCPVCKQLLPPASALTTNYSCEYTMVYFKHALPLFCPILSVNSAVELFLSKPITSTSSANSQQPLQLTITEEKLVFLSNHQLEKLCQDVPKSLAHALKKRRHILKKRGLRRWKWRDSPRHNTN